MNYTRENHPEIGCGPVDQVDLKTGSGTEVAQEEGPAAHAQTTEPEASPGTASDSPVELPAKRMPPSFQRSTRPGRHRFDSQVHLRLRTTLDYTDCPRILLPVDLRDEIEEEYIQANDQRRGERNARSRESLEEQARWRDIQSEHERVTHRPPPAAAPASKPPESEQKLSEKERKPARRLRQSPLITSAMSPLAFCKQVAELAPKGRLAVYSLDALKKLEKGGASADSEAHKRNHELFTQLKAKGTLRRVGLARSIEAVLALEQSHPHFSEVIQFVADRIALQKASRRPVTIPPMLLFGPPGVGKTHFCEALASTLRVPVRRHPMDQAETSSALLGSEQTWGNTRYGLVFEMLALGDYANPVVILDELDKACRGQGSGGSMQSPTAVLHSLLEPVSASKVRDISVDMELDASLITWIATANYPWLIPPTLRSRMKEFLIRMPTAEQSLLVAASVVTQAIKDSGTCLNSPPDRRFIAAVAHLTAREIYQATAAAAASAARRGRQGGRRVELLDLPHDVLLSEEAISSNQNTLH
jgi:ATP-dependent Lon protease